MIDRNAIAISNPFTGPVGGGFVETVEVEVEVVDVEDIIFSFTKTDTSLCTEFPNLSVKTIVKLYSPIDNPSTLTCIISFDIHVPVE